MIKYIIILILGIALAAWWNQDVIITGGGTAMVASDKVKAAMLKIGYKRDFRLLPCGRLEVKLNNTWQRLRY